MVKSVDSWRPSSAMHFELLGLGDRAGQCPCHQIWSGGAHTSPLRSHIGLDRCLLSPPASLLAPCSQGH